MNPANLALQVDLAPFQAGNVGFPKPRSQTESNHRGQVCRQFSTQALGFLSSDPANPLVVLFQTANRRRLVDPAPFPFGFAKTPRIRAVTRLARPGVAWFNLSAMMVYTTSRVILFNGLPDKNGSR